MIQGWVNHGLFVKITLSKLYSHNFKFSKVCLAPRLHCAVSWKQGHNMLLHDKQDRMGCSKAKASTLRTTNEEPLRARLLGTSAITRACILQQSLWGCGAEMWPTSIMTWKYYGSTPTGDFFKQKKTWTVSLISQFVMYSMHSTSLYEIGEDDLHSPQYSHRRRWYQLD